MRIARLLLAAVLGVVVARPAAAQQRPLVTEDPETIGAGRLLLEGGVMYQEDVKYPATGLAGNLWKLPTLGLSIGLSSIAELQMDGGPYNRLSIQSQTQAPLTGALQLKGDVMHDVEDLVMGTKIRLAPEAGKRPAFGFRFATKLPNAEIQNGVGSDTTDFYMSVLAAKTVQSVRIVGNIGLGILPDATNGHRQNDLLTYGGSFARALTTRGEIVGEVNGRVSTRSGEAFPGTETRGTLNLGARYTRDAIRFDAGLSFGLTTLDPTFGFTTGFTYVFHAFTVP